MICGFSRHMTCASVRNCRIASHLQVLLDAPAHARSDSTYPSIQCGSPNKADVACRVAALLLIRDYERFDSQTRGSKTETNVENRSRILVQVSQV